MNIVEFNRKGGSLMYSKTTCWIIFLMITMSPVGWAHWDPGDGHKMHFPQLADPHGWDVCFDRLVIADDFACSGSGAITDIHFWISWRDDIEDEVLRWDIFIYDDAGGKPGLPLWKFKEGKIKVRLLGPSMQGWLCPCIDCESLDEAPDNHQLYAQINITEIAEPFEQEANNRYWLVIHAAVPINETGQVQPRVGWKTTPPQLQWGSGALWKKWPFSSSAGWFPVHGSDGNRYDMAFVINGKNIPPMDFGDADETKCDDPSVKCNTYPTTLARNGARHIITPGVYLGNPLTDVIHIDAEPDGQPTPDADGDDLGGADDEDGVFLPKFLVPGTTAQVTILASTKGFVDAWIDFNGDGDWDDKGERIFYSKEVHGGHNVLEFAVPQVCNDIAPIHTFARFRFSTAGHLNYFGPARDGEVEDYTVIVQNQPNPRLDFGDAPEWRCDDTTDPRCNSYPTTLGRNGARHKLRLGVHLGRYIDAEPDGQPDDDAMGDDLKALDDEDGVFFAHPLVPANTVEIKVIASVEGYLNAWIDFAANGNWDDAYDRVFVNQPLKPGVNYLSIAVPPLSYSAADVDTYARFRYTTYPLDNTAAPPYAGLAEDGEVEDYFVHIESPVRKFDFGDAPDEMVPHTLNHPLRYPTRLEDDGARHLVHPEVYLGNPYTDIVHIDAEPDGLPSWGADGDDMTAFDDEDGVDFVTPLVPGFDAEVEVMASVKGYIDAWIDFNADGDWDDFGEQIFASEPVVSGGNTLKLHVPKYPYSVPTNAGTYARFRFSTYGRLNYTGPARNGEVEDYHVFIKEPPALSDLGDAPDSTNNFNVGMHAYTSSGMLPVLVPAHFPTVYDSGDWPVGPIHHNAEAVAFLGARVSLEQEADYGYDQDPLNNIIPRLDRADLDKADDGVRVPLVLPSCRKTRFHYIVSVVRPVKKLYVNAWFDWNRDGDWDDVLPCKPSTAAVSVTDAAAPEWAVRNQVISEPEPGIHRIETPAFLPWHPWNTDSANLVSGPIWMRITISEQPWNPISPADVVGFGGSGPKEGYRIGETEDYFFVPILHRVESADLDCNNKIDYYDLSILATNWLQELRNE